MRRPALFVAALLLVHLGDARGVAQRAGARARAASLWDERHEPSSLDPDGVEEECGPPRRASRPRRDGAAPLPLGRAIGTLEPSACEALLDARDIAFERVPAEEARGVEQPIRLRGSVGPVVVTSHAEHGSPVHAILDCRLAIALLAWSDALASAGVARVEHVSMYRPGARVGGTSRASGHSHGLAIDVLGLRLRDGTFVEVEGDWLDRARGVDPCIEHAGDDEATALMRGVVCTAVQRDLFQVVLTPHYDDAHGNHVHLEVVPEVGWSVLR